MAKNDFLQRRAQRETAIMQAAERLIEQFMEDTLEIALKRKGYGYKRVCDILAIWESVQKEYTVALHPSNPEADVAQDRMDNELRALCKGKQKIVPCVERYPELKTINYEGRKR